MPKPRATKALFEVYRDQVDPVADVTARSSAGGRTALVAKPDPHQSTRDTAGKGKAVRWEGKTPFSPASPEQQCTMPDRRRADGLSGAPGSKLRTLRLDGPGPGPGKARVRRPTELSYGKGADITEDGALADVTRAYTGNGAFRYSPRTGPGELITARRRPPSPPGSPSVPSADLSDPLFLLANDEPPLSAVLQGVDCLQLV